VVWARYIHYVRLFCSKYQIFHPSESEDLFMHLAAPCLFHHKFFNTLRVRFILSIFFSLGFDIITSWFTNMLVHAITLAGACA